MTTRDGAIEAGLAILVAACGAPLACSSGGGSGGPGTGDGNGGVELELPEARLTRQEGLTSPDLQDAADRSEAFTSLLAEIDVASAGVVEDDAGRRIWWAESSEAQPRTAVRACDGDDCSVAMQTLDGGTATWTGPDGAEVSPLRVGTPPLLKDVRGHDPEDPTELTRAGLAAPRGTARVLDEDEVPPVDYETRQLVLLNTYGDLVGMDLGGFRSGLSGRARVDALAHTPYAREPDVRRAFRALDGMDALVWVTQGVRQELKDGWAQARTVGVTVNRGGFGDETLTGGDLAAFQDDNVAAGPGVVVLAGSATRSDGSANQPDGDSLWGRLDEPGRTLVGVDGHADARFVLRAARAFLDSWLSGDRTFAEALEAGNEVLAGTGASLVSNLAEDRRDRRWPAGDASFWSETELGAAPSSAQLRMPISTVPHCGPPGSSRSDKEAGEEQVVRSFTPVSFDGPRLEGSRAAEEVGVDLHVRGILTGLSEGDRILFELQGNLAEEVRGFRGFAEGIVEGREENDDGQLVVRFDGLVHHTPYRDDADRECIGNNPRLTTPDGSAKLLLTP